jgi:hypothetical protein
MKPRPSKWVDNAIVHARPRKKPVLDPQAPAVVPPGVVVQVGPSHDPRNQEIRFPFIHGFRR